MSASRSGRNQKSTTIDLGKKKEKAETATCGPFFFGCFLPQKNHQIWLGFRQEKFKISEQNLEDTVDLLKGTEF